MKLSSKILLSAPLSRPKESIKMRLIQASFSFYTFKVMSKIRTKFSGILLF